jgi:transposase
MTIRLTDSERSRLRGMARRPRSRKQLYRAEAILALDEGRPIEEVARRMRLGVERVEAWVEGFEARRLDFLDEPPGRARRREGRPLNDEDEA